MSIYAVPPPFFLRIMNMIVKRPRLQPNAPLYCICRRKTAASDAEAGWGVTMARHGARYRAHFADSMCGSAERALQAAQAFRDALLALLPTAAAPSKPRRNNTSGMPGVYRGKSNGKPAWTASARIQGKTTTKSFPIHRYGERAAFKMAVAAREQWQAQQGPAQEPVRLPSREEVERIADAIRAQFPRPMPAPQKLASQHPLFGIQRIKPNLNGIGGAWRVTIRRAGQCHGAHFFDLPYQGEERALLAAQAFRDALLACMPPRAVSTRAKTSVTNRSGVVGVRRHVLQEGAIWQASLTHDGRRHDKAFSVSAYGEQEAFELAVQTRQAWLRQYGLDKPAGFPMPEEIAQIEREIRLRFGENAVRMNQRKTAFNPDPYYGIYRHEADTAGEGGAWHVNISRRNVMHRKNFLDSTHGGRESTLACAQAYRDHVVASMPPLLWREKMEIRKTNNTSGVVGVSLIRKKGVAQSWHAGIQIQGKKWQRSFSIRKYGYDNARERAIQYRLEMLQSVEGEYVMHPVAKKNTTVAANAGAC